MATAESTAELLIEGWLVKKPKSIFSKHAWRWVSVARRGDGFLQVSYSDDRSSGRVKTALEWAQPSACVLDASQEVATAIHHGGHGTAPCVSTGPPSTMEPLYWVGLSCIWATGSPRVVHFGGTLEQCVFFYLTLKTAGCVGDVIPPPPDLRERVAELEGANMQAASRAGEAEEALLRERARADAAEAAAAAATTRAEAAEDAAAREAVRVAAVGASASKEAARADAAEAAAAKEAARAIAAEAIAAKEAARADASEATAAREAARAEAAALAMEVARADAAKAMAAMEAARAATLELSNTARAEAEAAACTDIPEDVTSGRLPHRLPPQDVNEGKGLADSPAGSYSVTPGGSDPDFQESHSAASPLAPQAEVAVAFTDAPAQVEELQTEACALMAAHARDVAATRSEADAMRVELDDLKVAAAAQADSLHAMSTTLDAALQTHQKQLEAERARAAMAVEAAVLQEAAVASESARDARRALAATEAARDDALHRLDILTTRLSAAEAEARAIAMSAASAQHTVAELTAALAAERAARTAAEARVAASDRLLAVESAQSASAIDAARGDATAAVTEARILRGRLESAEAGLLAMHAARHWVAEQAVERRAVLLVPAAAACEAAAGQIKAMRESRVDLEETLAATHAAAVEFAVALDAAERREAAAVEDAAAARAALDAGMADARLAALEAEAERRRCVDLARLLQASEVYAAVDPAALRVELARTQEALAAALRR